MAGHFRIRSTGEYSRLNTSALMYRRSVIDRAGYYDSVRVGADAEFLDRLRLVYGEGAVVRIRQPTMLCLCHQSGPVSDAETGMSATGRSGAHLAYRASFGRWHHAMKDQAYLPFPHVPRRFPAPHQITVEVTP
jgi:hypothetical protein